MEDYDYWLKIAEAQKAGASQNDKGSIALFYNRPVHNERRSETEGRAVYDTVPYIQIRVAGDPRTVVDQEANDLHKKRWPQAWAAFLQKQTGPVDGTPLEHWPYLTVAQVAELKHIHIATIEQLAGITDGNLANMGPGGRQLRDRAKQHLQSADETEKDLRTELARKDARISELEARINQLMARPMVAAEPEPEPETKRGPGRPRKAA